MEMVSEEIAVNSDRDIAVTAFSPRSSEILSATSKRRVSAIAALGSVSGVK